MSKDLYYTILQYFEKRLDQHSCVRGWSKVESDDYYLYDIERTGLLGTVRVWLSDAYKFTDFDYHNRPNEISSGDYVLIAKPEGGGGADQQLIAQAKIGVGKIAEFMGALNSRRMWKYVPPTEEEKKAKTERRFR